MLFHHRVGGKTIESNCPDSLLLLLPSERSGLTTLSAQPFLMEAFILNKVLYILI